MEIGDLIMDESVNMTALVIEMFHDFDGMNLYTLLYENGTLSVASGSEDSIKVM